MKTVIIMMLILFSIIASAPGYANELKVLTDRTDVHLTDLVAQYKTETGVNIALTLIGKGLIEISKTGEYDVILTKHSSELVSASQQGLLKRIPPKILSTIPEAYRDSGNTWFLLSYRIRGFIVDKKTTDWPRTYADLAKPQYRGRICVRQLTDNYNLELFGTMLRDMGKREFTAWFKKFKDNLARDPAGNDRNQVKAIYEGVCDIAIANTYYMGLMKSDPEQKAWADNTVMYIPDQGPDDNGAITLFSGVGIMSDNTNNGSFLSFLLRDDVQRRISTNNFEYPLDPKNTSAAIDQYGEAQGLSSKTIKLHPNIQRELFDYRRRAYIIVKEN